MLKLLERLGLEAEEALATVVFTGDDTGTLEDSEVLGYCLATDLGIARELRDRSGLAGAKASHQGKTGLVAESGENPSLCFWLGGDALTDFA